MQINYQNIIYIVGDSKNSFAVVDDKRVIEIGFSLYHLQVDLKDQSFMPINGFTIINTKYFVSKNPQRQITLKGGSIHKVSRNFWKHF